MFKRKVFDTIYQRLCEPRKFLQVVMGPRQVGKTTVVKQVLKERVGCRYTEWCRP